MIMEIVFMLQVKGALKQLNEFSDFSHSPFLQRKCEVAQRRELSLSSWNWVEGVCL